MSGSIFSAADATPRGFLDQSKPAPMVEAEKIFRRLSFAYGEDAMGALQLAADAADVLKSTKSFEMDELWTRIEKKLNNRKALTTKMGTDEGKVQVAYSLLYEALNQIDRKATSTAELNSLYNLFFDIQGHVESKFLPKMSSKDQRVTSKIG